MEIMAPNQTASIGRSRTGRFTQGNPGGPGRPRGLDFRAVVAEKAEGEGIAVEDAIWDIFQSLLAQARQGDVQAAKLLIERLCGKETIEVEIGEQMPPMSDVELAAQISAILAAAARRQEVEAASAELLGCAYDANAHRQ